MACFGKESGTNLANRRPMEFFASVEATNKEGCDLGSRVK
jgi:hypothetical protein